MPADGTAKIPSIQVISRAADILRALAEDTNGLSLGQIAAQVNLPRSTVQRIVSALAAEGFVSTRGGNGGLRLGPEIQSLAQASSVDRTERLKPIMQEIADKTGETVDLAVLERGQMLFIDQIVGSQRLRTVSRIGESFPLTTTANGKAALACLDPSEAARLILTELEAQGREGQLLPVLEAIDTIRKGELATDEDEHTEGVSAMGFAIREPSGDVIAVSVPVPSSRFGRVRHMLTAALQAAREHL